MIKEFYENLKISIIIHVDDLVSLVLWLKDVSRVNLVEVNKKIYTKS